MHAQAPIVWYYKELKNIVHIPAAQSDKLEKCAPEGRNRRYSNTVSDLNKLIQSTYYFNERYTQIHNCSILLYNLTGKNILG